MPGPLTCQRELLMADYNNQRVVSLVVKKGPQSGTGAQKYRLPFKNMGAQEMELEFTFAKQTAVVCGPASLTQTPVDASKTSPIEFSVVPPSTMKVPGNDGSIILNIQAKLKNSYQLQTLKDAKAALNNPALAALQKKRPEKYNHLLIAKVKDTQVMFSFVIEATVIEATGPANAMS